MADKERFKELYDLFQDVEEGKKILIRKLISEVVYLEGQMDELRSMPMIKINPRDPSLMKTTPAAKLYKECSQSYMNAVRILLSVIRDADQSAQDELLRKLEAFS